MSILEKIGVPEGTFGNFSINSLAFWGFLIFAFFVIVIISGVIAFFYYSKKSKKLAFKNSVPIFICINGKHQRIDIDKAKELFVPDSNISLFYLKKHKIYLARPTRMMGENEFWYSISENGEWVNFDLSMNPEQNTLATANYDHRDTRYAYTNLKEIIKRNYKDKQNVWWKDPVVMNIIAFVIMSIIFVGACWFLIAKMGGLINETGKLIEQLGPISQTMADAVKNAQNINSGIIKT